MLLQGLRRSLFFTPSSLRSSQQYFRRSVASASSSSNHPVPPHPSAQEILPSEKVFRDLQDALPLERTAVQKTIDALLQNLDPSLSPANLLSFPAWWKEQQSRLLDEAELCAFYLQRLQSRELLATLDAKLCGIEGGAPVKDWVDIGTLLLQYSAPRYSHLAVLLWELAARQNQPAAMFCLAQIYRDPPKSLQILLPEPCLPLAAGLCMKAADMGILYAKYNLGLMYMQGHVGALRTQLLSGKFQQVPNYNRAFQLFHEAAEGDKCPPAWMNLANMYRFGLGTDVDVPQALALYRRASEHGDPKAKFTLANLYATGVPQGVLPRDPYQAFQLWHEAAVLAQRPLRPSLPQLADPEIASLACYNLGNCYFLGIGLPDQKKPHMPGDLAPVSRQEQEDPNPEEEAPLVYGRPDYRIAFEFWRMASTLDPQNLRAHLHVGNMLMDGMGGEEHGVQKDLYQAIHYYSRLLEEASRLGLWSDRDQDTIEQLAVNSEDRYFEGQQKQGDGEEDAPRTSERELCLIAHGLLQQCQRHLELQARPEELPAASSFQSKQTNILVQMASDIYNARQHQNSNAPSTTMKPQKSLLQRLLHPYQARDDLVDVEQEEIVREQDGKSRDRLRQDAHRFRWKYVEQFASTLAGSAQNQ